MVEWTVVNETWWVNSRQYEFPWDPLKQFSHVFQAGYLESCIMVEITIVIILIAIVLKLLHKWIMKINDSSHYNVSLLKIAYVSYVNMMHDEVKIHKHTYSLDQKTKLFLILQTMIICLSIMFVNFFNKSNFFFNII